jgi:hypothetical protein
MKTANLVVFTVAVTLMAFSSVFYTSCSKGDSGTRTCKNTVCANGGICNKGICTCASGYEGPLCETLARQKFLGTWVTTENRTLNNVNGIQYTLTVVPGPNISEVRIKNLYNLFEGEVSAFITGDSISVPQQVLENYGIVGTGWIEVDKYYGENARVVFQYKVTNETTGETDFMGAGGGSACLWNK